MVLSNIFNKQKKSFRKPGLSKFSSILGLFYALTQEPRAMEAPFDSDYPSSFKNFSTPESPLKSLQDLNTDKNKYQEALENLEKLEVLFRLDPYILDANNDNIPDFSDVTPAFITSIFAFYSDLPEERLPEIYRTVTQPLINILGGLSDLSITRSKSRFLKPLKCLGDMTLINNPLILLALKEIVSQPGSLKAIKICLKELYNKGTVSDEHIQGIDILRRLAGYFYDKKIIEFLNHTNCKIDGTIDLSSNPAKLSCLRALQLQGELFLMLHPSTFNLELSLPDIDLLKDIRHGLSHMSPGKLKLLLKKEDLIKEVWDDLIKLKDIFIKLNTSYPTFDPSEDSASVKACWEDIKAKPLDLLPRNPDVSWRGLEEFNNFLKATGSALTVEPLDVKFEQEITLLCPPPVLSQDLSAYLQLKKAVWSSLTNFKDGNITEKDLKAAFSAIDSTKEEKLRSSYQEKTQDLSKAYQEQLKALRQKQKQINQDQEAQLKSFSQECQKIRKGLKLDGKKISQWFKKSPNADAFATKVSEAVGKEEDPKKQHLLLGKYKSFYTTYQKGQQEFDAIKNGIETDPEISNIRKWGAEDLLRMWFEDGGSFEELKEQAEEHQKTKEQHEKLQEYFQRTYQQDFYKGGKKISDIYSDFIEALKKLGIAIEETNCTYNWIAPPPSLENIFHKVYRVYINGKPITTLEDKILFRQQKAKQMLEFVEVLRELLNIATTVELEMDKRCFHRFLTQKSTLMNKLEVGLEQGLLTNVYEQIKEYKQKFCEINSPSIYGIQDEKEFRDLEQLAFTHLQKYIELIPTEVKDNIIYEGIYEGLVNTSRHEKWVAAFTHTQKKYIQEKCRWDIGKTILDNLTKRWEKNLSQDFYGCEYLLACFYETFKSISDFPEFSGLGNSHKIRNQLFHMDPFQRDPTPFFSFSEGSIPNDHLGFVAKEAMILSVNVKFLLENIGK